MKKFKNLRKKLNRWILIITTINFLTLFTIIIFIDSLSIINQQEYIVSDTMRFIRVSAYNSEVAQCDNDPWITASGLNLKEHWEEDIIATNVLPFKTKLRIPDYYGDKIFTVEDRMNRRYKKSGDIWMKERTTAIIFGVKKDAKIEILAKNPNYDSTNF